jgi:hypothetical protein
MLRVFICITELKAQNQGATIRMSYLSGSYRSAVLEASTSNRFFTAVDNFTDSIRSTIRQNYLAIMNLIGYTLILY